MCRVALIDDEKEYVDQYQKILKHYGIDLIFMEYENGTSYSKILEWLLDNRIEFVLVDYKLSMKYEFQGSELIQYLNNAIPDLQCVLFTSNTTDDDLVLEKLKIDKNVFSDKEKLEDFINTIKQGTKVFNNRMQSTIIEYQELLGRKNKLSSTERELFSNKYKILESYGLVESLPKEYFEKNLESKLDTLLKKLEEELK